MLYIRNSYDKIERFVIFFVENFYETNVQHYSSFYENIYKYHDIEFRILFISNLSN